MRSPLGLICKQVQGFLLSGARQSTVSQGLPGYKPALAQHFSGTIYNNLIVLLRPAAQEWLPLPISVCLSLCTA